MQCYARVRESLPSTRVQALSTHHRHGRLKQRAIRARAQADDDRDEQRPGVAGA